MPHKQNPVRAVRAVAAATRAPGLVATLLAAMLQEHERAAGGWQAEWDTLPALVGVTIDAAESIAAALEDLTVDEARIRQNLDANGGVALAEALSIALAHDLGRTAAMAAVERVSRTAARENRTLLDVAAEDREITRILEPQRDGSRAEPRVLPRVGADLRRARPSAVECPMTDDGCRLSVMIDGPSSGPPLVLSNSLGTDIHLWDGQLEALGERHRVVRYDMRGHGASDAPAGDYTLERLGRDVLSIMEARASGAPRSRASQSAASSRSGSRRTRPIVSSGLC